MKYETRIGASLEELKTPLRRLLEEGGPGSFLVLVAAPERNHFVQAVGSGRGGGVHLEAVSNEYLDPEHALGDDQAEQLVAFGWNRPGEESPNFWSDLELTTDEEYAAAARLVMRTLVEVYGMGRDDPLQVELHLE